jgi:hypothetical protein
MIWEFDPGDWFASDCFIRQRVPESDILQRNAHITVKPLLMKRKRPTPSAMLKRTLVNSQLLLIIVFKGKYATF